MADTHALLNKASFHPKSVFRGIIKQITVTHRIFHIGAELGMYLGAEVIVTRCGGGSKLLGEKGSLLGNIKKPGNLH